MFMTRFSASEGRVLDAEIVRCCGRARLPISWYQIGGGLTVNWTDPSILRAAIHPRYIRLVEPKSPYSAWRSSRPPLAAFMGSRAVSCCACFGAEKQRPPERLGGSMRFPSSLVL